jgi:hypothetical protein
MKQLGRVFWFLGWLASAAFLHAQKRQITGHVRDSSQAAEQNPPYTFGDAPRDFGSGPGMAQVDASLLKDLPLREQTRLRFRTEALDALNHPNWANPNTQFASATFGEVTGLQGGNQ